MLWLPGEFQGLPQKDDTAGFCRRNFRDLVQLGYLPKQPSFRRKPESRKSYRKRASRLPSVLDSGFRRNDGFVMRLTGEIQGLPQKGDTAGFCRRKFRDVVQLGAQPRGLSVFRGDDDGNAAGLGQVGAFLVYLDADDDG